MEKVILLGLSGTTKWSLTWSSGGNTFFFCLNKDFGRTLTWTRVKCGLLPGRTARSWRTFVAPLHPVHVSSLFCHFYLLLEHLISLLGRRRALLVDGKSQHRWQLCGYILCSLERTPSNKLNFPYPDIIYQNLHYTLCKNYLHYIHYLQTSIFSPQLSKHCSRNSPSLNLTALRAVLRITAPRAGMSNYVNKQIPLKTGLASYLVSKLHGSEVRNFRDQRVFFSHSSRSWLRRSIFAANNRKKTSGTQGTPSYVIVEVFARQKHLKRATGHLSPAMDNIRGLKS